MIDAKKVEELISRKTELLAETEVYITIGDFISSNMDRCKNEQNYSQKRRSTLRLAISLVLTRIGVRTNGITLSWWLGLMR